MVQNISSKSMCCLSYSREQTWVQACSEITSVLEDLALSLQYPVYWGTRTNSVRKMKDISGGIREQIEQILGEANYSQDWCPSLGFLPLYSGRIELALNVLRHWKGDVISSSTKCSPQMFLLTNCEPAQSNGKGTKEGSGTLHFTHL